ncbi:MAG: hypothetical protein Kow00129_16850 [Thermoleophilia bacterium]
MDHADRITDEVVVEYVSKARSCAGKAELEAGDYVALAQEAADKGLSFAAAVYFALAGVTSLPLRQAEDYCHLAQEMLWRVHEVQRERRGE